MDVNSAFRVETENGPQVCSSAVVACEGGAQGHPRVFLHLSEGEEVRCPYCSKRFVLEAGAAAAGH